ncbi:MAG: hypothetical protein ACTSV7_14920 [Candidatus Baldrarchaeia archaeon]
MFPDFYALKSIDEAEPKYEEVVRVFRPSGNVVRISRGIYLNLSDKTKAANWGIFGKTGRGKTTALMIIANQYKNALVFDSKGGAIELLDEYNIKDEWELYSIGETAKKRKQLRINVADLPPTIVNVLYSGASDTEKRRIRKLTSFLRIGMEKKKGRASTEVWEKKNYENFMQLLENERLEFLADELSIILDKKDKGIPLERLCRGKKLIDVTTYDYKNRSIGVLVDALFFRIRQYKELQKERLLIGTDDIQSIGTRDTAFGRAMGDIFSKGRQFNVSGLVAGTNLTDLDKKVKGNVTILLVFETEYDKEALWKYYRIDVEEYMIQEGLERLQERGTCILSAPDFGFDEARVVHFDIDLLKKPEPIRVRRLPRYDSSAIDTNWFF